MRRRLYKLFTICYNVIRNIQINEQEEIFMPQELVDMMDQIWTFFFNFFYTLGDKIKSLVTSVIPKELLPTESAE